MKSVAISQLRDLGLQKVPQDACCRKSSPTDQADWRAFRCVKTRCGRQAE